MNRQIVTLRGLFFAYYATTAILGPYLPLYFQMQGYSASEIGLLINIGPFIAILAQPFWGFVSDRLNSVKSIIGALWALTVLCSIGLFTTHGFGAAFWFVLLMFFFMLPSVPLLDAFAVKSTSELEIGYGSVRMWGSLGYMSVATVSGIVLAGLGGVANIPYLYWVLWLLPLFLLFFLKDDKGAGEGVSLQSVRKIGQNAPFLWFLFLVFLISVPHRMNDALFSLYLGSKGATEGMVGWAWAFAAGSEIPTFALLGRYMNRFNELSMLGVVSCIYVVRWLFVSVTDDPWILLLTQASHCITFAVLWIVAVQYTARLMPGEFSSTGQSLLGAVFMGMAGLTGGLVGGWINDSFGGREMYVFGAVLSFIAAILFFATQMYERRKRV